jgi:hypothetical protein
MVSDLAAVDLGQFLSKQIQHHLHCGVKGHLAFGVTALD